MTKRDIFLIKRINTHFRRIQQANVARQYKLDRKSIDFLDAVLFTF